MRAGHVAIIALRLLVVAAAAIAAGVCLSFLASSYSNFPVIILTMAVGVLVLLLLPIGWLSQWRLKYIAPAGISVIVLAAVVSLEYPFAFPVETLCDHYIAADKPLPESTPVKRTLSDGTRVVACGDLPPDSIFTQG
jgi:hypothetical protein